MSPRRPTEGGIEAGLSAVLSEDIGPLPSSAEPSVAIASEESVVAAPAAPKPTGGPPQDSKHRALYDRVISALYALPARFETTLRIQGVPATDLFTMNSALGAAIEKSVVDSLNELREMWDPIQEYAAYKFARQSQRFPDVLLISKDPANADQAIIMGIELKGWFVISKEGEPSFRYTINPDCCAESDLIVVIPWLFDGVTSGKPILLTPIIKEARYAALVRNHHWQFLREDAAKTARGVKSAPYRQAYPTKKDRSSDVPEYDNGKNFGRVARCGLMDDEVKQRLAEDSLGIPNNAWRRFIKIFSDGAEPQKVEAGISSLATAFEDKDLSLAQRNETADHLRRIADMLLIENKPVKKIKKIVDRSPSA